MSSTPPIVAGHTSYGSTAVQLLEATAQQVEEVATFRTEIRNYSIPRMQSASATPLVPLADMQPRFDATA